MPVGKALREARIKRGLTQGEVGQAGYISNKMISAIERGARPVGPDALERMSKALDYHRLYMAAAESVTGGVYTSPWLDGDGVDLHRSSVWAKTTQELKEALDSLSGTNVINKPSVLEDWQLKKIHESLIQVIDVRVAVDHYVGIICEEFGFSLLDIYREHRGKLESRGYVKTKKKSAR